MKNVTKFLTTITFVLLSFICCLGQNVTISNQSNMDAFDPSTTVINGNLIIQQYQITNNPIIDLSNLSNLTSISGNLIITTNSSLTNLTGLSNLTTIGGFLKIDDNDALNNITDLSNLTSIGGTLRIYSNVVLGNITGLSSLTSIGENLSIESNNALVNLDGLSNLAILGGELYLQSNNNLVNLDGLSSLTAISGNLSIRNNNLTNIDGLSNVTSIDGNLVITGNPYLTNLAPLSNLTTIPGALTILSNSSLNINGLSNITSIDGGVNIRYNGSIQNLFALSNLAFVDGDFTIRSNGNLADCCDIQNLLNTPEAITGVVDIANNPSECSSKNEIINTVCGLFMRIFNDINQDCISDNNETGIPNRQFIIQPGDIIGQTNTLGYFDLSDLFLGDYTITIDTSGEWSTACPIMQSFTVTEGSEEAIPFGLVSTAPCTAPDISIHMPTIRPCFENQRIYIQACNIYSATGVLENAFVIVELDSLLTPTSSLIPYTDLGNHMYQFDLGTLNPGICANFWIETTLSCDAEFGQGLCMEAQLFPAAGCVFDDIPNPFPSNITACDTEWDLSSLEVEGYCQNDSIFFEITNNGLGDMTCFNPVNVYINGNLIIMDSVQLISGETAFFAFSTDGQSWWLEVVQHPLHPGNSQPNAIVEGCGESIAAFSNYVNAMALDDADPVVDIYCGIVTGSYDPNDKTGFPLGINESNDILPNQKMEYLIRFQNTGTDTAFTVVIRDTLSTDFDIFSVQSGVGSHPYEFTMYGSRIMQWTFNNILLPDSTTNEIESHGFIKFTVDQIPNLSEGTILENNAGIYFDFNDPIITNTSQHTINYFTPEDITTTNISETACGNYTSPSGNVWTNTGTYYDVSEIENSIVIVDLLIVESIDATIQPVIDYTITANIPNATYQWLNCDNNSMPISGATNQTFTPTETGNYAVQITQNDCVSVSDCYNSVITGINNSAFAPLFNIHPNPTSDNFQIEITGNTEPLDIQIYNSIGQKIVEMEILENSIVNTNTWTNGVYSLVIFDKNGKMLGVEKVLKMK